MKPKMEDSSPLLYNGKFLSSSHEYLPRYIVYRAVLPFTQLREVSYRSRMRGGRRCWTWKYPIATTAPTNLNMMIIVFLIAPLVLSTTPNTDDPPGEHHPWMHLRDHLKSRMHICLVPHNACQWWSRELASLEELCQSEVRIRWWSDPWPDPWLRQSHTILRTHDQARHLNRIASTSS